MKPHIRCSSLDREICCPGSRTLTNIINADSIDTGEVSGNAMTWRGSWIHWESARRLIADHGAMPPDGGLQPPEIPSSWQPTQWDYFAAEWFVTTLLELTPKDHIFFVEQELRWETDTFLLTGHIDVYSMSPDGEEVHWNDQKTGPAEVDEAGSNWQVGGYGALLKVKYPNLKRGTARILQRGNIDRPVSEVEIDDMDRICPFIAGKLNAALLNAYLFQTGKQCIYCPALLPCAIDGALNAEIKSMKLILTAEKVAAMKTVPELKELAELARQCRILATPMDKIIDALKERMTMGKQIVLDSGYIAALVEENGRRKVIAPKAVWNFCSDKVDEDKLWNCFEPSLAAIEDALVEGGMKRSSKTEESATGFIKGMSHLYEQTKIQKLKFLAQ